MDKKEREGLQARYQRATHAMQSGVALMMFRDPKPTEPKHLRVGVNSAMSDHAALVKLLIAKGVFTEEEYLVALCEQMEREAATYQAEVKKALGGNVEIKLG